MKKFDVDIAFIGDPEVFTNEILDWLFENSNQGDFTFAVICGKPQACGHIIAQSLAVCLIDVSYFTHIWSKKTGWEVESVIIKEEKDVRSTELQDKEGI